MRHGNGFVSIGCLFLQAVQMVSMDGWYAVVAVRPLQTTETFSVSAKQQRSQSPCCTLLSLTRDGWPWLVVILTRRYLQRSKPWKRPYVPQGVSV